MATINSGNESFEQTKPDSTQFSGPQESGEEDLSKYFQGDDDTVSVKWYDDNGYPHERKDLDKQGLETLKGELNTPKKPWFFNERVQVRRLAGYLVVDQYQNQEGPLPLQEALQLRDDLRKTLEDQRNPEDAKLIDVKAVYRNE